jgi:hypothetical protein
VKLKKLINSVVLFSLIISMGCQKSPVQKLPGIDLPLSEMNIGIKLLVPEEENSNIGSPIIWILVTNTSDYKFRFSEQSDIYVFEFVDKEWIPIENLMDYGYGEDGSVYLENDGPFAQYSTVIGPAVTIGDENILLRIVCVGEYISPDGSTNQQAGAYRDFWLTPNRTVLSIDEESP